MREARPGSRRPPALSSPHLPPACRNPGSWSARGRWAAVRRQAPLGPDVPPLACPSEPLPLLQGLTFQEAPWGPKSGGSRVLTKPLDAQSCLRFLNHHYFLLKRTTGRGEAWHPQDTCDADLPSQLTLMEVIKP